MDEARVIALREDLKTSTKDELLFKLRMSTEEVIMASSMKNSLRAIESVCGAEHTDSSDLTGEPAAREKLNLVLEEVFSRIP